MMKNMGGDRKGVGGGEAKKEGMKGMGEEVLARRWSVTRREQTVANWSGKANLGR